MRWRVERARNGRPALVRADGTWAESRFAPDVDAARRVEDAEVEAGESILLIGCGGGELPRALLARIASEGRLLIAEPHAAALAAFFASETATDIIGDARVTFLVFAPEDIPVENGASVSGRLIAAPTPGAFYESLAAARDCDRFVVHPGLTIPPGLESLRERVDDIEIRRRSSARFRADVELNLEVNRERFLESPGVNELRGVLAGRDIVVAGGGPSLETLAREIGPDADWIAVGRSLRTLVVLGVRPHCVVLTDPQPVAAQQILAVAEAERPPLVAFPTSSSSAVRAAPRLIAAFAEQDGGRKIEALRAEIGELPAGGTVVTTAIGLAILMGAARVFLAGVDLVEPRGRTHTRGTAEEASVSASLQRFGTLESGRFNRARPRGGSGDVVPCDLMDGSRGESRGNLLLYGRAIGDIARRTRGVEFVQLSPRALAISGVRLGTVTELRRARTDICFPTGRRMRKNRDLPW